jgi:DNA polymerase III alpha subunit (gram-positive type)
MSQAKFIIIDTETSGLWPRHNGLIEFAGAIVDSNLQIIDTITLDIQPPKSAVIDPVSLKINKFTTQRIANGVSYSEACDRIQQFVTDHFLTTTPIFVGQFYPFDYAFLVDLFVQSDRVQDLSHFMSNKFIDTKSTVMMANLRAQYQNKPVPFPSTSLSAPGGLKDSLSIGNYDAHTALGDVLATHEVLQKLVQFGEL